MMAGTKPERVETSRSLSSLQTLQ
eukprot:SAG22_NODE_2998_length_2038_cov_1.307891_4_plen_23_part_01